MADTVLAKTLTVSALGHAIVLGALLLLGRSAPGVTTEVFTVQLHSLPEVAAKALAPALPAPPAPKKQPAPPAPPARKIPVPRPEVRPVVVKAQKPAPAMTPLIIKEAPVPTAVEEYAEPRRAVGAEEAPALPAPAPEVSTGAGLSVPVKDAPAGPAAPTRAEFLAVIREAIASEVSYPRLARRRKLEGTVLAGFSISPDGMPLDLKVLSSSGHHLLDREVLRIIRRAAPYPPLKGVVSVPVSFRLVDAPK